MRILSLILTAVALAALLSAPSCGSNDCAADDDDSGYDECFDSGVEEETA